MSSTSSIPIYITNVQPLLIDDSLIWDIYYLTSNSHELHCLRIFNIQLSFLVARLPSLSLSQFEKYMSQYTSTLHTEIRNDLAESSYFNFGRNREYLEIFSKNPQTLLSIYNKLNSVLTTFYSRITDPSRLSPDDELFYRNTETPFRYTESTTRLSNTIYNLSTKYNIPLIGGAQLRTKYLTSNYPDDYLPNINPFNIHGLDAQTTSKWNYSTVNANINNCLTKDESVDFKCNMRMLSYDIETYNPDGNLDPNIEDYYIFALGIGIFNLNDRKPLERLCIISKPFESIPKHVDSNHQLKCKYDTFYNYRSCIVYNEYVSNDDENDDKQDDKQSDKTNDKPIDKTTYIFTKNEKELLSAFIDILTEYKPQIITGFNTFGFDDNYIYTRMTLHSLDQEYLQTFTYYDILDPTCSIQRNKWFTPFMPKFRQFTLKIDNEPKTDNNSVRAWLVLNVDVYKLMLKEDPKRFTQYGRGNLDSMLEAYSIKNPYSNSPLAKTGLKIPEMYRRWEHNENIYSIALYCCQDAWITGTLLISRSKLADLIEMSFISNTSLADSIYHADGTRVANSLLRYAYEEKFALMDTPFVNRHEASHDKNVITLGGKKYDHRTIVGGQVRNIHAGRQWFVVALDYSSMYPANKEATNVDSSSRVDSDMIMHPDKYGIKIVRRLDINDMYGKREIYYVKA